MVDTFSLESAPRQKLRSIVSPVAPKLVQEQPDAPASQAVVSKLRDTRSDDQRRSTCVSVAIHRSSGDRPRRNRCAVVVGVNDHGIGPPYFRPKGTPAFGV